MVYSIYLFVRLLLKSDFELCKPVRHGQQHLSLLVSNHTTIGRAHGARFLKLSCAPVQFCVVLVAVNDILEHQLMHRAIFHTQKGYLLQEVRTHGELIGF